MWRKKIVAESGTQRSYRDQAGDSANTVPSPLGLRTTPRLAHQGGEG